MPRSGQAANNFRIYTLNASKAVRTSCKMTIQDFEKLVSIATQVVGLLGAIVTFVAVIKRKGKQALDNVSAAGKAVVRFIDKRGAWIQGVLLIYMLIFTPDPVRKWDMIVILTTAMSWLALMIVKFDERNLRHVQELQDILREQMGLNKDNIGIHGYMVGTFRNIYRYIKVSTETFERNNDRLEISDEAKAEFERMKLIIENVGANGLLELEKDISPGPETTVVSRRDANITRLKGGVASVGEAAD